MKRWLVALPLVVTVGLGAMFAVRLADDTPTTDIPSALIGRIASPLTLTSIEGVDTPLLSPDIVGKDILILNIWASWCGPCRAEHPQITALSELEGVSVVGLNHKDRPQDAIQFLNALGNPYDYLGADRDGRVSLQYGVYGLPETFIIDRNGIVRKKYVGAITPEIVENDILPLLARLEATS